MHMEIAQAVEFLGRLLNTKIEQDKLTLFKESLMELLKVKFTDHWDIQQPYKGNGFRALSNFNGQLDTIIVKAATGASIPISALHAHLPRDFVLWIDPFSVSYRVGDHGNIMTLFEDRSRGRVTLKLDPNSTTTITNDGMTSPSSSPLLQYLQPRTSTPIRISPPNSPEAQKIKNHINQASPLSNQVTDTDDDDQHKQHLVMAN